MIRMNSLRSSGITRRRFLQAGTLAAAGFSMARVLGANERIGIGIIGFGLMGRIHTRNFKDQQDAAVRAVCDVYRPRMEAARELCGPGTVGHQDFRRLLDDKTIDAVVISTPDHWHALMTMMACAAGKDVYIEKPLTLFVQEGRWMMDVAKRTKRVVQVGVQNRSGPNFQRARAMIREGQLGKIVSIGENFSRNLMPGFGNPPDQEPPSDLDWDLWLGPAPKRPYNPNRGIYHFRWIWDYAGGQMTNLGQHSLDLVHWITGVTAPKAVYSSGGRFHLKDNMETPDTQDTIIEYPEFNVVSQYREATAGRTGQGMGAVVFYGTRGLMPVGRTGFELMPDRKVNPMNAMASILGGHPAGGPQKSADPGGTNQFWATPVKDATGDGASDYVRHARNFLDCIKSREQPICELASSHEVATVCHLANISLRTGRKIVWNASEEKVVEDPEANRMLTRPYREPWASELTALGVS
ncbi:MAG: Gfo/Idh/MocA family protein [Verrucomicrobiia bacterium]